MGAGCTRCPAPEDGPHRIVCSNVTPVTLNVYDIGSSGYWRAVNKVLRPLGTGLFHCGVEVYNWEWSFSFCRLPEDGLVPVEVLMGPGIFCCTPKKCDGHSFCTDVLMGHTFLSEEDMIMLLGKMESNWPICGYDILKRNCCHFSSEFCRRLGVGDIPRWVVNMANAGAAVEKASLGCCNTREQVGYQFSEVVVEKSPPRPIMPITDSQTPMPAISAAAAAARNCQVSPRRLVSAVI